MQGEVEIALVLVHNKSFSAFWPREQTLDKTGVEGRERESILPYHPLFVKFLFSLQFMRSQNAFCLRMLAMQASHMQT